MHRVATSTGILSDRMTSETSAAGATHTSHGLAVDFERLNAMDVEASTALFGHAGYLPLPGLLEQSALETLRTEATKLWKYAKRRDFNMECMGGTPRHMTTLGGLEIVNG